MWRLHCARGSEYPGSNFFWLTLMVDAMSYRGRDMAIGQEAQHVKLRSIPAISVQSYCGRDQQVALSPPETLVRN